MSIKTFLIAAGVSLASLFLFLRRIVSMLFFYKLRIKGDDTTNLIDKIAGRMFVIYRDLGTTSFPRNLSALCYLESMFFHIGITERMLRAGWESTDSVIWITVFRWKARRMEKLISNLRPANQEEVPVHILMPYESQRIGMLNKNGGPPEPYMERASYENIEQNVKSVIKTGGKTGLLLHGPPGNGKSYFARYIALKYMLPIYIASFTPETDNNQIIRMFSHLKGPAIVLFEDFDSYFSKKECMVQDAKFTFDVVLNILDGVFSTPCGIIFIMTANDIEKIDMSLKDRPSRFKWVTEIGYPSESVRTEIFKHLEGNEKTRMVTETAGQNLDKVLNLRDTINGR